MVGNAFCNCISAGNFNTNKSVAKTVCGRIHLEYGHGRHALVCMAINSKPHKVVCTVLLRPGRASTADEEERGWKNKVIVAVTFVMKSQQPTKQMIMSPPHTTQFKQSFRMQFTNMIIAPFLVVMSSKDQDRDANH